MVKLSIIIPVYNSSKILNRLVNEINSNLCEKFKNDYEIILVNDFELKLLIFTKCLFFKNVYKLDPMKLFFPKIKIFFFNKCILKN